jgi:sporulation protein YlmC with PRC-barrel domain
MADIKVAHSNIRAGKVKGTAVYSSTGERLGSVEDIVIGKRDGRVKYAVMSFGGFLGIGEEYHPLPWDMLTYDTRRDGYVVPVTREQLEGAPRYAAASEPDWQDEAWQRGVYTYYGLPWV